MRVSFDYLFMSMIMTKQVDHTNAVPISFRSNRGFLFAGSLVTVTNRNTKWELVRELIRNINVKVRLV